MTDNNDSNGCIKKRNSNLMVAGVVLMVAITIILFAVIAVYVIETNAQDQPTAIYNKTITIARLEPPGFGSRGVIDNEGYGYYIITPTTLDINGVYNIIYTVNSKKERWIADYTPLTSGTNPHICVEQGGVCK